MFVSPAHRLGAIFHAQFTKHIVQVRPHRVLADKQRAGDIQVRRAAAQFVEDLAFPLGQRRVLYWSRCMVRSVHRRVHHAQFSRLLAVQHGLNALN